MNINKILSIITISISLQLNTSAQILDNSTLNADTQKTISSISSIRHLKQLPSFYSGYAIEIAHSELPMNKSTPLFQRFGNIHFDFNDEAGYSYLILTEFSSEKGVKSYFTNIVKVQVPEAKAFVYKDGKRKEIHFK